MSPEVRSCRPDELERLVSLLDEEFIIGKGRSVSLRQRFPAVYCGDNLPNILVCADGESIVSALAIRLFDWRAGHEVFRGAMIGAVYTIPARRREGLASHMLEAAATRLREEGADFGVLWTGQPSFYSRHGWIAADSGMFGEFEQNESMPDRSITGMASMISSDCSLNFNPVCRIEEQSSPEAPFKPIQELTGDVAILPVEENAAQLERIRQSLLVTATLRRPEDYRQIPIPSERVAVLWCENQGQAAYAMLGNVGETGFLYELVGDAACFSALWREACCNCRRIFINDQIGSASSRWLADHANINWKNKNLAMWLPLSNRVDVSCLGQWYISYFDRI